LRSFARQLGTSHSTLSQVLSGKRPLSKHLQRKMAMALGLSPDQLFKFQNKIEYKDKFQNLEVEKFEYLSDGPMTD
jgi:transcriptional regulator with XRE-family HTH domain